MTTAPPDRDRPRVLVVEDTDTVRRLLVEVLDLDGWEVTAAVDGLAALSVYPRVHPHVVLTDVDMPRLDGIGLTRALRAGGESVPVVVVTGRDDPDTRRAVADAGADAFLTKPFGLVELRECVRGRLAA